MAKSKIGAQKAITEQDLDALGEMLKEAMDSQEARLREAMRFAG